MTRKAILVIDPSHDVGEFLRLILEMEGYRVTTAQSIDGIGGLLSGSHFDLVITGDLDQHHALDFDPTFIAKLKAIIGSTPLILYSYDAFAAARKADSLGLAGVVQRSSDIFKLTEKVKEILGNVGPTLRTVEDQ